MKRLKNVLLAGLLIAPTATAQTVVTAGPSTDPYNGFVNVFELDCVAFVFNSPWGVPDLTTTFDDVGETIEMTATPVMDPADFWYQGPPPTPGGPGVAGNKCMDTTLYYEVNDDSLAGMTVTFEGTIIANTLTPDTSGGVGPANGYTARVFIRDFVPDFSSFVESSAPAVDGVFSISLATDPGLGRHIQYGFQIIGPNVWPGDEVNFGSLLIGQGPPDGTFADFCNGDGGNQMGCTDCPCGNNAPMGSIGGCLNSSGSGTRLIASGSPSVSLPSGSTTDLQFGASGSPAGATNVLISGNAVAPQSMANPCFGLNSGAQAGDRDGLRCAVQSTIRHGNRAANGSGEIMDPSGPNRVWGGPAQPTVGLAAQGGFAAGQTRYFQITHREDILQACMRGLNTSQAVEVTFTP